LGVDAARHPHPNSYLDLVMPVNYSGFHVNEVSEVEGATLPVWRFYPTLLLQQNKNCYDASSELKLRRKLTLLQLRVRTQGNVL